MRALTLVRWKSVQNSEIFPTRERSTKHPSLALRQRLKRILMSHITIPAAVLCFLTFVITTSAQSTASSPWATDAGSRYWVQPDIVYQGSSGQSLKLDVWYQHDIKTPNPTLVYIHGGG